jgi:hypothetical protein
LQELLALSFGVAAHCAPPSLSIKAIMSSIFQTVVREEIFKDFGNLPDLTPAHQVDLLTGISAGIGGLALGLPMICGNLKKPVSGNVFGCIEINSVELRVTTYVQVRMS